MRPLLSFVFSARNDNYQGNSSWRLEAALNFLANGLKQLGRLQDVEIVIVDWCSPKPLHSVLRLTEETTKVTRFILVQVSSLQGYKFDDDFPRAVVTNTGIRRATGLYIVPTVADALWTRKSLSKVFNFIDHNIPLKGTIEKTLLIFGRKEIPYDVASCSPSLPQLERFIEENDATLTVPYIPYLRVPGDGLLMHRDLWFHSRSFDERMHYWGWHDCDIILRVQLKYFLLSCQDDKDLVIYHLAHIAPGDPSRVLERKTNPWIFNPFTVNDTNWGLGSLLFNEYPPRPRQLANPEHPDNGSADTVHAFRLLHFLNILKFAVTHRDRQSLVLSFDLIVRFLADAPERSITKHVYNVAHRIISMIKSARSGHA